ncbi:MAG: hypothetical protein AB7J32_25690 [Pseudonocardia sp.]
MSTHAERRPTSGSTTAQNGLSVFAGVMMIIGGAYHAFMGLSALFNDKVYLATPEYIYQFDLTGWGWIHLILGIVVAAAGIGVLKGMTWGRVVGIVVASISLIVNFLFLPHYPLWSILIIALDVAIIWALATYARDPL